MCKDVNVSESSPSVEPVASWHPGRMIAAWAVAAAIGVFVTVFVGDDARALWLVLAVGVSTLVAFALQLGTAQREGFITRLSFSVAGSVVVIAAIDIIGMLVGRGAHGG